ncbi:MAG: Gfo/Idh/MocA family oxidoreductase, partial [Oscillospiraceae bacterium]
MPKIKILRIGIIGCGWFGNFHIDNLLKMENVEIVALYNRGIERLEKTGKKVPKARMYQDIEKMLSKEKLDAAIISLTPDAHADIEERCCKKGIHMYVEKPVEISLAAALKKSEAVKFSNVITAVGYQERYSPVLDLVKEIIAKEPVGLVYGSWIGGMPGPKWWRTKEESGGQIVEQTTHIVDMLRYLFGEVKSVYAAGTKDQEFEGVEHDV